MKCKFDTFGTNSFLKQLFGLSAIFSLSSCFALLGRDKFMIWLVVSFIILILSLIGFAAAFLFGGYGGTISALEDEAVIFRNSKAVKLPELHIGYDEIERAEYQIKDVRSRICFWYYEFILTIRKKSGKEVKLGVKMYIEESKPLEAPEKYKKYIDGQPIMKIFKYINERVEKIG